LSFLPLAFKKAVPKNCCQAQNPAIDLMSTCQNNGKSAGVHMANQNYGALLRWFRKKRAKRLSEVASLAGIDLSYLCRIERGERAKPSASIHSALIGALGLSTEEISLLEQPQQDAGIASLLSLAPGKKQVVVMVMDIKDAKSLLGESMANQIVLATMTKTKEPIM
jgi:transcriptional regulator with XRE-family HTH domain